MEDCRKGVVNIPSIKDIPWRKAKEVVDTVNAVVTQIQTKNSTEDCYLMQAAGIVIGERLLRKGKTGGRKDNKMHGGRGDWRTVLRSGGGM